MPIDKLAAIGLVDLVPLHRLDHDRVAHHLATDDVAVITIAMTYRY